MRSVLAALAALLALPAVAVADTPSPGAAGIGDRLFPKLGNGGYDVAHYTLRMRYPTTTPSDPVRGTVTIRATATQALSRFDLDWGGGSVTGVRVDGAPAAHTRSGNELVVTPAQPIADGTTFTVKVSNFVAHPTSPNPNVPSSTAFFTTPSGSATAPQPNFAHFIYPSNDHPRDKATFTFVLDVPAGETAVANGQLVGEQTAGGRSVWTYAVRRPMATELTQIAAGSWDVIDRGRHAGVHVRDVLAPSLASLAGKLEAEDAHLRWLQHRVGTYPFATYGSFVVDTSLGFALETQTLSLFDEPWFDYGQGVWNPTMVHELAHQWFGDSVSPWSWSDVWLNEGHASWYEYQWAAQHGWLADDTGSGTDDFTTYMKQVYAEGDQLRHDYGPVARPRYHDVFRLFSPNVYEGGALVLYALRQRVGSQDFARIERAWVSEERDRSASTDDFIALASRVTGHDLGPFLRAWVYGTTTPPMPGHPDWTVDPVQASSLAPAWTRAGAGRRR